MRTASQRIRRRRVASFTAHFIPEAVGGYSVIVPALPGCNTQGETFEEAARNARDAVALYVADLAAAGEPIPEEAAVLQTITVPVARRRV